VGPQLLDKVSPHRHEQQRIRFVISFIKSCVIFLSEIGYIELLYSCFVCCILSPFVGRNPGALNECWIPLCSELRNFHYQNIYNLRT
jgi:hypothetical protein